MVPGVELFDSGCQGASSMSKITPEQIAELLAQDKTGRVTRENFQRFLLNPDGGTDYTVSVDYGKTVEEMVASGRYDWSNGNITSKNFPVNGTGVVTVALELVHLNKAASSGAVLAHLKDNGTLAELLAFGATYPEIQREFPIVCLDKGSSWVDPGDYRDVPYLDRDGSDRKLSLDWFDCVWDEDCRFLAVRK